MNCKIKNGGKHKQQREKETDQVKPYISKNIQTHREIHFPVKLQAYTNACVSSSKLNNSGYDFSITDKSSNFPVIDKYILQNCLKYKLVHGIPQFYIIEKNIQPFISSINLLNIINVLNLNPNDMQHNYKFNKLSYPGISDSAIIKSPETSNLPQQYLSYLASLLFYNSETKTPFNNITSILQDLILGLEVQKGCYITLGQQLINKMVPTKNSDILRMN